MMQVGTVTVTGLDGSNNPVLGPGAGGMALAIYQAIAAEEAGDLPGVPTLGQTSPPYSAQRPATPDDVQIFREMRLSVAQRWASRARALAKGIVEYIQANAEVDLASAYAAVTTESLGRTPDPLLADTPIEPPSSPVHVPLTTSTGPSLKVQ